MEYNEREKENMVKNEKGRRGKVHTRSPTRRQTI